ncbi:TPA: DUF1501 domain-containing protein [Candidatus Poribacteria bacterium]|nr:DUF1501 domain-containing protein [Candidatus Poribacteria bacterium]
MNQVWGNITGNDDNPRTLVVVFLRGGTDGLTLVSDYWRKRPVIAVNENTIVRLEGEKRFGLHPLLAGLTEPYSNGDLAVIHCVGSEDSTRSHFEVQDLMEHGGVNTPGGWLGRFLRARQGIKTGPLSAMAFSKSIPECLRGAPSVTVLESLDDFFLGKNMDQFIEQLEFLYGRWQKNTALQHTGMDTMRTMRCIEKFERKSYQPENGAEYGDHSFSRGLSQVAQLIKTKVGLDVASVDLNGWDSHWAQDMLMNQLIPELSQGLQAFYHDLGRKRMETVSVVVMTEFGRRLYMNSSLGTNHGRGNVMFVMGGGVKDDRVLSDWKGLKDDVLEGKGDLPVTTNYRNVLVPILERHGTHDLSGVFPEHELSPLLDL